MIVNLIDIMNTFIWKVLLLKKYDDLYYHLIDARIRGWELLYFMKKLTHKNWFSDLIINYIMEFPHLINIYNIHKFIKYKHPKCNIGCVWCMCHTKNWIIDIRLSDNILIENNIINHKHTSSIVYITELTKYEKLQCGWISWKIKDKNNIRVFMLKDTYINAKDIISIF